MSTKTAQPKIAQYGTWESPISVEVLTGKTVSLGEVAVSRSSGSIYHIESRPVEAGRSVICRTPSSSARSQDVLPKGFNARSGVHEYGGAAYTVYPDRDAYLFVDFNTRGVFQVEVDGKGDGAIEVTNPKEYVPGDSKYRYANLAINPAQPEWVIAVKEDHTEDKPDKVINSLVAFHGPVGDVKVITIAEGKDFYTSPTFSPDGKKLAWLQWSHPDMPWTGTELCIADWDDGKAVDIKVVAGHARTESISQPRFNGDGVLFYISDKTGYWQLYKMHPDDKSSTHIRLNGKEEAEFGFPDWLLGWRTYGFLTASKLVTAYVIDATSKLAIVDYTNNSFEELDVPFVDISPNSLSTISETAFAVIASTPSTPSALYICTLNNGSVEAKSVAKAADINLPEDLVSKAEHITFPRISSPDPSSVAYAFYYKPQNPAYSPPESTLPPLVISLHGGPTSASTPGLSLSVQYWTSRGYAYAFVNYSGSTGYGRKFRDSLNSLWGVADVSDAADCVHYLTSQNVVDKSRVGVVGGSAGGYGVLQSICSFPDIWAACVSNYGISSLEALIEDTHKFESKYMDALLWNFDTTEEEKQKIMGERSPLLRAKLVKAPTLLLQGVDDKVVPKEQAEKMAEVIRSNNGIVDVVLFEGEGHGWRRQDTMVKAIELQESWWRKYLVRG